MNSLSFDTSITIAFGLVLVLIVVNITFIIVLILKKKAWSLKKHLLFFAAGLFLNIIVVFGSFGLVLKGLDNFQPRINHTYPDTESIWDNYDKPLEVYFSTPVDIKKLDPSINPNIRGTWKWEKYLGIDGITKKGKFYPSETVFEDQRIVVYIAGISRPGYDENHEFGFVFDSVKMPTVIYTQPFNNASEVSIDSTILINFNKENLGNAQWQYTIEPLADFEVTQLSETQSELNFKEELLQSTRYLLTISRRSARIDLSSKEVLEASNYETVAKVNFATVKEPLVKSFNPKGTGVKQDASVRIRFETEMKKESVEEKFKIEPDISGNLIWNEDSSILTFKPTELFPKETKYKFIFEQGIESLSGGVSQSAISFEFETIGAIKLSSTAPSNDELKVREDSSITIKFDQEVDQASAEASFSISPNITGTFSWENDSTLKFTPSSHLNFNTTYTVRLNKGIKSIFGIDSRNDFEFRFTTRSNQVVITIPQYFQPQSPPSFSCNVYAARMALGYKGYNVDIVTMISEMGYDDRYQNGQWLGNPYVEYVGTYDGGWGYGVYWDPIRRLFTNRGIQTELYQGWNLSSVAKSIENGNPVVIWRYNGESANYDKNWVAEDGTYVYGINGQHGGVIAGFRGTSDNPTHFFLNDPWYGQFWIETSLLDYYWSRLGRVGLVIK